MKPLNDKIYFDTNIFIYVIEEIEINEFSIYQFFSSLLKDGHQIITSELTISECLVQPKKLNDQVLEEIYLNFLVDNENVLLVKPNMGIWILASEIKAKYSFKLPDAIHIATAIQSGCSSIVTNDRQFKSIEEIDVLYLDDFLN